MSNLIGTTNFCNTQVGINKPRATKSIVVFPNSAKDYLSIDCEQFSSEILQLELYDAKGSLYKLVKKLPQKSLVTLDTKAMEAGMYLLRIIGAKESSTQKICIEK
jgi:hypothetical protein